MTKILGTNIAAPIVPFDTADTYPTHDTAYGLGGKVEVRTLAQRDAIPDTRRRAGMLVTVTHDPVSANNGSWELLPDLLTWRDFHYRASELGEAAGAAAGATEGASAGEAAAQPFAEAASQAALSAADHAAAADQARAAAASEKVIATSARIDAEDAAAIAVARARAAEDAQAAAAGSADAALEAQAQAEAEKAASAAARAVAEQAASTATGSAATALGARDSASASAIAAMQASTAAEAQKAAATTARNDAQAAAEDALAKAQAADQARAAAAAEKAAAALERAAAQAAAAEAAAQAADAEAARTAALAEHTAANAAKASAETAASNAGAYATNAGAASTAAADARAAALLAKTAAETAAASAEQRAVAAEEAFADATAAAALAIDSRTVAEGKAIQAEAARVDARAAAEIADAASIAAAQAKSDAIAEKALAVAARAAAQGAAADSQAQATASAQAKAEAVLERIAAQAAKAAAEQAQAEAEERAAEAELARIAAANEKAAAIAAKAEAATAAQAAAAALTAATQAQGGASASATAALEAQTAAETAKTAAQTARTDATAAATTAQQQATAAIQAQGAVAASAGAAVEAATLATQARDAASAARTAALTSATDAANAKGAADLAAGQAASAALAADDARLLAKAEKDAAGLARSQAETAAGAAQAHASSAESSRAAAAAERLAADFAKADAEAAAATVLSKVAEGAASATAAATSATTATTKAQEAVTSASTATTKAQEASGSATAAAGSATAATTKAGEAAASATTASTGATTAVTKAGEASSSAATAAAKAQEAATSAQQAAATVASIPTTAWNDATVPTPKPKTLLGSTKDVFDLNEEFDFRNSDSAADIPFNNAAWTAFANHVTAWNAANPGKLATYKVNKRQIWQFDQKVNQIPPCKLRLEGTTLMFAGTPSRSTLHTVQAGADIDTLFYYCRDLNEWYRTVQFGDSANQLTNLLTRVGELRIDSDRQFINRPSNGNRFDFAAYSYLSNITYDKVDIRRQDYAFAVNGNATTIENVLVKDLMIALFRVGFTPNNVKNLNLWNYEYRGSSPNALPDPGQNALLLNSILGAEIWKIFGFGAGEHAVRFGGDVIGPPTRGVHIGDAILDTPGQSGLKYFNGNAAPDKVRDCSVNSVEVTNSGSYRTTPGYNDFALMLENFANLRIGRAKVRKTGSFAYSSYDGIYISGGDNLTIESAEVEDAVRYSAFITAFMNGADASTGWPNGTDPRPNRDIRLLNLKSKNPGQDHLAIWEEPGYEVSGIKSRIDAEGGKNVINWLGNPNTTQTIGDNMLEVVQARNITGRNYAGPHNPSLIVVADLQAPFRLGTEIVGPNRCSATLTRAGGGATVPDGAGGFMEVAANLKRYIGRDRRLMIEGSRTNYLLNSAAPVTQTVTVPASARTMSFYGTGTVVLSGAFSATMVGSGANNRTVLSFTPTAGDLVITITGDVRFGQLEDFGRPSSWIPTTSAPVTRATEALTMATTGLFPSGACTILFALVIGDTAISSADQIFFQLDDGSASNRLIVANAATGSTLRVTTTSAGTTVSSGSVGSVTAGQLLRGAITFDASGYDICIGSAVTSAATAIPASVLSNLRLGNVQSFASNRALQGEIAYMSFIDGRTPKGLLKSLVDSLPN